MRLNVLSTVVASAIVLAMPRSAMAFTFDYTGSLQEYRVQDAGVYSIFVVGAPGGSSQPDQEVVLGGAGSIANANFNLQSGDILEILVGQRGKDAYYSAGGGGGTFVVRKFLDQTTQLYNYLPLIVAGGGDGSRFEIEYSASGGGYVGSGSPTSVIVVNDFRDEAEGGSSFLDGGRGGNGAGYANAFFTYNGGAGGYGGGAGGGRGGGGGFSGSGSIFHPGGEGGDHPGIVYHSIDSGSSFIATDRLASPTRDAG
jgi:hypothetical protein